MLFRWQSWDCLSWEEVGVFKAMVQLFSKAGSISEACGYCLLTGTSGWYSCPALVNLTG